jgi:hypothetical protein
MALVDCAIARVGYEHGHTGIEIAEQWITTLIDALHAVRESRAHSPATFPGFGDATAEETASRIVARLLDAGWRPPDVECLNAPASPQESA